MDLIPPQVKLAIVAVTLAIILGLGLATAYYHGAWVSAREDIAKLKAEQAQLSTSAKNCSDGTDKLAEDAAKKDEAIKKAQAQANILAKNNEALAQALLGAKPGQVDSCKAAVKLFQEYKAKKEVK